MSETDPARKRPDLRLQLFGGPVLSRRGRHVRLSPFQAGLLAVVFGEGRDRTPRLLVERLLWQTEGERGPPGDRVVRHRTSQLIYQTNRRCQAKVVEAEREFLRVRPGVLHSDLDDFHEMMGASRLLEAAELLERGFLGALRRRATAPLLDWAEERRLNLRALLRQKAVAGWQASERSQEWAKARQAAEVLLGLAPTDETMLRRVMRASAMGGMVREAEAVYHAFAERGERAGGWVPDPATSRLLSTVRASAPRTSRPVAGPARAGPERPFVGRSGELARLTNAIGGSDAGQAPATIAVRGLQGVGKTRLVRQALRGARFRGFRVVQARARELEREIPFGSLADALLDQPWLEPVLRRMEDPWRQVLLSGLSKSNPSDAPTAPSRLLCDSFFRLLEAAARSSPVLLFLDDFHWTDPQSVVALHFVRRRWRAGRLVLVAAYRPVELRSNDPARRFVLDIGAGRRDAVVSLEPLDRADAFELAKSAASPPPPARVLDEIVELAGGNPSRLVELAIHNARRAAPVEGGRVEVPEKLRMAARRRIDALDGVAAKVASALAVHDAPVALAALARIAGYGADACGEALERLEELGLVGWTEDGFCMVDAVARRVVYEEMRPARRALLHAAAARVLLSESSGAAGSDGGAPLDQVAGHYQRAGDKGRARVWAVRAAEQAGPDEGAKLLQLAYDSSFGRERRDAAVRLAQFHYQARNLKAARGFAEEVLAAAQEPAVRVSGEVRTILADARFLTGMDEPDATLGKLARLEEAFSRAGDSAMVLRVLDATLDVSEAADAQGRIDALFHRAREWTSERDGAVRRHAFGLLARQAVHGSPEAGVEWGRKAARLAREPGDATAALLRLVQALRAAGLLATEEGRAAVLEARSMAEATTDVHARGLLLHELATWQLVAGSRGSAARVLTELRLLNQSNDCPRLRFLELLGSGNLALERGALADARSIFAEARNLPPAAVARRHGWRLAGLEGRALLELGQLRNAGAIAKANPLPAASQPCPPAELVLFHARLALRTGDLPGAWAVLERHLACTESSRPVCWLRIALEHARLARRSDRPYEELAERARASANALGLVGLAHEFLPFVK